MFEGKDDVIGGKVFIVVEFYVFMEFEFLNVWVVGWCLVGSECWNDLCFYVML